MVRSRHALAALELIEGGVTTVADMYYFETEVGRVVDEAGMRGVVGQTIANFAAPDAQGDRRGFFALSRNCVDEFAGHRRIVPSIAPHAPYSTGLDVSWRASPDVGSDIPACRCRSTSPRWTTRWSWCRAHRDYGRSTVVEKAGLLLAGSSPPIVSSRRARNRAHGEGGRARGPQRRSNAKAGRGIAPVVAMRGAGIRVGIATDGPMSGNTLDLFAQFAPVSMFQKLARTQPQADAGGAR